ncbi:MAG: hypothetical protein JRI46_11915 [Deltaproteobacteria bacterium]|nr:hypothetical protein [Deltaproteobacteria bacterium]
MIIKPTKYSFLELSQNERRSYEETWVEWNFDKYYSWLLEGLRGKD